MANLPLDADLALRLGSFLADLAELTQRHGIVIAFVTGQEYLETPDGDTLPLRINRANGSYVAEEPYN